MKSFREEVVTKLIDWLFRTIKINPIELFSFGLFVLGLGFILGSTIWLFL